jgi:hypothetical protein
MSSEQEQVENPFCHDHNRWTVKLKKEEEEKNKTLDLYHFYCCYPSQTTTGKKKNVARRVQRRKGKGEERLQ